MDEEAVSQNKLRDTRQILCTRD